MGRALLVRRHCPVNNCKERSIAYLGNTCLFIFTGERQVRFLFHLNIPFQPVGLECEQWGGGVRAVGLQERQLASLSVPQLALCFLKPLPSEAPLLPGLELATLQIESVKEL